MVYENIIKYCEEHGITIARFEKLCGIGNGVVAAWKEENEPSLPSLKKIAAYTGIPVTKWLEEEE